MAKTNIRDYRYKPKNDNDLCELIDTSDWRNAIEDRRHILKVIIWNHSIKGLERLIVTGWDVNDLALGRTLLQDAVLHLWKEAVRLLLKAGANVNLEAQPHKDRPLTEAITAYFPWTQHPVENREVQVDIIKLLLEYGADPNACSAFHEMPLTCAIKQSARFGFDTRIIDMLLENGADASHNHLNISPLSYTLDLLKDCLKCRSGPGCEKANKLIIDGNAAIFKSLVRFGAEFNMKILNPIPILHKMVGPESSRFLPTHLDVYFQNGGDMNVKTPKTPPALTYCVEEDGVTNNVRWLIRHGADTTQMKFWHIMRHLIPFNKASHVKRRLTPFILLKAGFQISDSMVDTLIKIKQYLLMCVEQGKYERVHISCKIRKKCSSIARQADSSRTSKENNQIRCGSLHQMADLQEFSDESLHVYPEDEENDVPEDELEYSVMMVSKLLDYLTQPRTLQWWCRCCIRKSLVSLHPSAVKTLPSPSSLKRYILCHEL